MSPHTLTCPAPAKLNLFLHVVGRRADGYHLLQTLFRLIDFGDTLHFTLREDGEVYRLTELEGVPSEQDLCVRAARLLQQETGCKWGVDIAVEKHIPMGGGLGGGSSDAATTLLALNDMWDLNLPRARLMQLGLALGADVPFFIFGENAYAEGVGEQLQPVTLPDAWYVLLFPPVQVATAQIFNQLNYADPKLTHPKLSHLESAHPELTQGAISLRIRGFQIAELRNDLQPVVCSLYPEVARHLAVLEEYTRGSIDRDKLIGARMTGSGACVFAEFASAEAAQQMLSQLPADIQGIVAQGLAHHPMRDYAAG